MEAAPLGAVERAMEAAPLGAVKVFDLIFYKPASTFIIYISIAPFNFDTITNLVFGFYVFEAQVRAFKPCS